MLEIVCGKLLSSMENETQNTPTPEAQTASQEVTQSPTQTPEAPKQKSWLIIGLVILVLLLLGTTGFLAYQNYQLKQQISKEVREIKSSPTPTLISPSPAPTPSYISKIDASLSFLQECRKVGECPEDVKEIVASDSVSVSIMFTHELGDSEIKSFEKLSIQFHQIDGKVSQIGTIYGVDIPWDKISDVEKEEAILQIESSWHPGLYPPSN
jgi:hypothetical protein